MGLQVPKLWLCLYFAPKFSAEPGKSIGGLFEKLELAVIYGYGVTGLRGCWVPGNVDAIASWTGFFY